jgi:hypothetical protein
LTKQRICYPSWAIQTQKQEAYPDEHQGAFFSTHGQLLTQRVEQAYETGDLRVVRRTTALLLFADGKSKTEVAETLSVSRQATHNWLTVFMDVHVDCDIFPTEEGRRIVISGHIPTLVIVTTKSSRNCTTTPRR